MPELSSIDMWLCAESVRRHEVPRLDKSEII
jgi:hypothetical protein